MERSILARLQQQISPDSEVVLFPTSMHPLLRAAACKGNLKALHFLLDSEEDAQPSQSRTSPALELLYKQREAYNKMQRASLDVEEGANMQAPSDASSLQRGVTVQGDTALHVVAASGDGNNYLKCATFIYKKDESFLSMQNDSEEVSFLFKQNIEHDTPLHLAARAGNKNMVIHLIDLAKGDNNDMDRVKSLLRMENESKETALHDAVRVGDDDLVKDLLKNDPELARFPTKGSSAMYLAVSLGNNDIAKILHDQDNGLSYLGPKGQNALHAAVLRGSGTYSIFFIYFKISAIHIELILFTIWSSARRIVVGRCGLTSYQNLKYTVYHDFNKCNDHTNSRNARNLPRIIYAGLVKEIFGILV